MADKHFEYKPERRRSTRHGIHDRFITPGEQDENDSLDEGQSYVDSTITSL